jgi:hypothetical protein
MMTENTLHSIILFLFPILIAILPSYSLLIYTLGKSAGYDLAVNDYNEIMRK